MSDMLILDNISERTGIYLVDLASEADTLGAFLRF
jgi:hypothetical protein